MPSKSQTIEELQGLEETYAQYPEIRYPLGYTFQGETRPARWFGSSWKEKLALIAGKPMPVKGIGVDKAGNRFVGDFKGINLHNGLASLSRNVAIHPSLMLITDSQPIKTMFRKKHKTKEPALQIVRSLSYVKPDPSTKDTVIKMKCNEIDRKENDIVKELKKYMAKLPNNQRSIKLRLDGHGHTDGGNDFFLGPVGATKILQAIVDKKNDNGEQQFTNITISDGSCMGKIAPHFKEALGSVKAEKNTTIGIRAANKTDLTLSKAFKRYEGNPQPVPSLLTTSATGALLTRKLEVHKLCGNTIAPTSPASQPTQQNARPLSATVGHSRAL